MLPDYPEVKSCAHSLLNRAVRSQIPREAPLLAGIRNTTIHEGRGAFLTKADASTDEIVLRKSRVEVTVPREQMRRVTLQQLQEHITHIARQLAEHQSQTMIETVERGADEVGNTVSAKELGEKEAFLEMERRMMMEFDPATLEPKRRVLVVHPTQVERLMKQVSEWEKDPEFQAKLTRIRQQKLEEWRARENRRQLVD